MGAIEVKKIKKSYGSKLVLDGVSFDVEKGSILAVLGPNGAGKTTTVKILSTLLKPDSGSATVSGFDIDKQEEKVRQVIGLTGQFAAVDEYLTGRENIELIGKLYHMPKHEIKPRATELLQKFDLVEAGDKPAKTYSGGMKRRLDLAMSLVAEPEIIFLDEPTTGLDPRSRIALWEMIKALAKSGTTILLTTQYMEEADYLAENIIVIDQGVVIAKGTPMELKAKVGADKVVVSFTSKTSFEKAKKLLNGEIDEGDSSITIPANKGIESLQKTLDILQKGKLKPDTASLTRPTLDDVFLALTGHDTKVAEEAEKGDKK